MKFIALLTFLVGITLALTSCRGAVKTLKNYKVNKESSKNTGRFIGLGLKATGKAAGVYEGSKGEDD